MAYEEIITHDNGHRRIQIRTYKDGWIWQHVDYSAGCHHVTDYSKTPVSQEEARAQAKEQAKRFGFS